MINYRRGRRESEREREIEREREREGGGRVMMKRFREGATDGQLSKAFKSEFNHGQIQRGK